MLGQLKIIEEIISGFLKDREDGNGQFVELFPNYFVEEFQLYWPALSRHLRSPLGNAFSRMDFMALSTSLPVSDSPYFENNGSDSSYMHLADPPS